MYIISWTQCPSVVRITHGGVHYGCLFCQHHRHTRVGPYLPSRVYRAGMVPSFRVTSPTLHQLFISSSGLSGPRSLLVFSVPPVTAHQSARLSCGGRSMSETERRGGHSGPIAWDPVARGNEDNSTCMVSTERHEAWPDDRQHCAHGSKYGVPYNQRRRMSGSASNFTG